MQRRCMVSTCELSRAREGATLCKVKNIAALKVVFGELPDRTPVEMDPSIKLSAKTEGDLRSLPALPEIVVVTTPRGELKRKRICHFRKISSSQISRVKSGRVLRAALAIRFSLDAAMIGL